MQGQTLLTSPVWNRAILSLSCVDRAVTEETMYSSMPEVQMSSCGRKIARGVNADMAETDKTQRLATVACIGPFAC